MPAALKPPVLMQVRAGAATAPFPVPGATSSRIWQSLSPYYTGGGAESPLTLATQFSLSQACTLNSVWWYSCPEAEALPGMCGIWDITWQAVVTEDPDPDWLLPAGGIASAGDGWVYCDFTAAAVTLIADYPYCTAVFQADSVAWYCTAANYWTADSGLPGENGITTGPITAPNTEGSVNGQGCNAAGQWEFPGANPGDGEVYYADVDVTPA